MSGQPAASVPRWFCPACKKPVIGGEPHGDGVRSRCCRRELTAKDRIGPIAAMHMICGQVEAAISAELQEAAEKPAGEVGGAAFGACAAAAKYVREVRALWLKAPGPPATPGLLGKLRQLAVNKYISTYLAVYARALDERACAALHLAEHGPSAGGAN